MKHSTFIIVTLFVLLIVVMALGSFVDSVIDCVSASIGANNAGRANVSDEFREKLRREGTVK